MARHKPHRRRTLVPANIRARDGGWDTPELVITQFAGEPSVDEAGNLYFVHHYYKDNTMIEADIYVARPRTAP